MLDGIKAFVVNADISVSNGSITSSKTKYNLEAVDPYEIKNSFKLAFDVSANANNSVSITEPNMSNAVNYLDTIYGSLNSTIEQTAKESANQLSNLANSLE